jgi:hypothetical protein
MNAQENLMAYASKKLFPHLTPREFSRPWTYVYREWSDDTRPKHLQRCTECVAVLIDREDGTQLRVTMADMLAEAEMQRLTAPQRQLGYSA